MTVDLTKLIIWILCEIQQISHEICWISWNLPENLINQIIQEKLFSFMECSGKAMSQDFMKSTGFHMQQKTNNCQEW